MIFCLFMLCLKILQQSGAQMTRLGIKGLHITATETSQQYCTERFKWALNWGTHDALSN